MLRAGWVDIPPPSLDYDEAIRLNPKYAKAYVNRGRAKRNLDQHYSAIDDFDKAISRAQ